MARRRKSDVPAASLVAESAQEEGGALGRGLEVLRLMATAQSSVSVEDVVEALRTTRATAHRLIATLVHHRFLRPSRDGSRFFADIASLMVGRAYCAGVDGLASLGATLRTFQEVERIGVTVWVRERTEGVCLCTSGVSELLVGRRFDLDVFAAGHALMWSAESAARIELLERSARMVSARSNPRPGAVYSSFHQLETSGYCLFDSMPESAQPAAAFSFRGSPSTIPLAFSLVSFVSEDALKPPRISELVKQITDIATDAFVT